MVQMSLAQTRVIDCDELSLLSKERGSGIKATKEECSKLELVQRLKSCEAQEKIKF
jgi:hypothetical protein